MTTYPFLETVPIGMTTTEVYVVEKNGRQTWLIPGILFCVCATVFLLCIITIFISARKDYDFTIDEHTQWSLVGDTYRIPTNVRPIIYHLFLNVYLPYRNKVNFYEKNFTFTANLLLKLLCERTTNFIVLNTKDLAFNINDVLLLDENDEVLPIMDVQPLFQKAGRSFNYFVKFFVEQPMLTGRHYTLSIKYSGILGNYKQGGLYASSYHINNETRYLAVTQNQINDASRILPCFDEPEMKAEFNITVRHPRGTKAISNGAIKSIKHFTNWTETQFDVTPKMSTYLLAIAISDFEQNYRRCSNHVQVRVWARANMLKDFVYMTEIACPLLSFYEDYFRIPYPLKKLDLFVAPQLRVLAMENWGLITAAENSVAYNKYLSDARTKLWVTDVVAHEIAHMWFGNLATMRWWNDMWINEGFATMMAVKAADCVQNTTIRTREYFTAEAAYQALNSDSYTEQPMSLRKNSTQVYTINKKILYLKAASVLRMIEATVGDEEFRETLNFYLNKYAYKNADKDEFLNCFCKINRSKLCHDAAVYKNISMLSFLNSWFHQPGFPLIQVNRNGNRVVITQRLYCSDPKEHMHHNQLHWNVPLFVKNDDPSSILWLRGNQSLKLHTIRRPLLLDVETRGYYRINYDNESWHDLIAQLLYNHTHLSVNARVRLINDAFALAENGHISYSIPLQLGTYLKRELNLTPILCFFRHYDKIADLYKAHVKASLFKEFGIFILRPLYDYFVRSFRPTYQIESNEKIWIQAAVISKSCLYEYQPCIQLLLPLFRQLAINCTNRMFSDNCNKVQPTVRRVVYAVASKYGTKADYALLLNKTEIETDQFEVQRLRAVLGYTRRSEDLRRTMTKALNSNGKFKISFQLISLSRRTYNDTVVADFLHDNFNKLVNASEAKSKQWLSLMSENYRSENDIEKLNRLAEFYETNNLLPWIRDYVNNISDDIRKRMEFVQANANTILQFLASHT